MHAWRGWAWRTGSRLWLLPAEVWRSRMGPRGQTSATTWVCWFRLGLGLHVTAKKKRKSQKRAAGVWKETGVGTGRVRLPSASLPSRVNSCVRPPCPELRWRREIMQGLRDDVSLENSVFRRLPRAGDRSLCDIFPLPQHCQEMSLPPIWRVCSVS